MWVNSLVNPSLISSISGPWYVLCARDVALPRILVRIPLSVHVSFIFCSMCSPRNFGGALSVLLGEGIRVVHSLYMLIPLQKRAIVVIT